MTPGSESRVCLVTGSSRGIGRCIARTLALRGDLVHVVWNTSQEAAVELEAEFPGRVQRADLTLDDAVRRVVAKVLERDARIDVVVHAVGDLVVGPLSETTRQTLDQLFTNNVSSAFSLAAAAREALRASSGSLLFLGSAGLETLRARTTTAAYTAAKTALLVLMRSLAREEARHGVRVNMLSPGIVPHAGAHAITGDPARASSIPLGRTASVDDIAEAALWLTSKQAGHVTGQNLDVAGGWML